MFNLAGQKIIDLEQNSFFAKSAQSIRWNANNLASGIYILNINGDLINLNHKLILVK